jgi:predicted MFS family arabinose efflux permease
VKLRGRLGALEEREFRLLWFSRVVSDFGDRFGVIGLAFAVLAIERSASALAYVLAARTVASIALFLVAGVWADRLPRQRVMLASDVGRGVATALMAVLLLTDRAEIWHLVVLAAVYGAAEAFFGPASQGLVPQTVSPARLQQANGLMSLSRNVTAIAGPAAAGVVIALSSPGWALAVDAATFAVSAAFLLAMRVAFTKPAKQTFLTDLREGWTEFTRRTWVWTCVCHFALFQAAALAPFFVLGPLIAEEELGGASAFATITAFGGVGSVIGSLAAMRFQPKRQLVAAFLSLLIWTPVLIAYALAAPVLVISAFGLVAAAGINFAGTLWFTALQQHVPQHALSRVSSYDWAGSVLFLPLGYILVGPLAEQFGAADVLYAAAAWTIVSSLGILAIPSVRNLRSAAAVSTPEEAPARDRDVVPAG